MLLREGGNAEPPQGQKVYQDNSVMPVGVLRDLVAEPCCLEDKEKIENTSSLAFNEICRRATEVSYMDSARTFTTDKKPKRLLTRV
ncbi:hypothetical protein NDU88_006527 [Pleurodeles waltl]|uniref:Uncharacterized protein n=1 Tax=Pleurodeles waltl TaxID=8319 RepID=A0AAV7TYS5_PLEWA|nr:hypothetical protein NDU88_006527 [Pleurodeles waltl]